MFEFQIFVSGKKLEMANPIVKTTTKPKKEKRKKTTQQ